MKIIDIRIPIYDNGKFLKFYYFEFHKTGWSGADFGDELTVGEPQIFTGKHDCKGKKIYEGDINRNESEQDIGDERSYDICVWIAEWNIFAWLTPEEYNKYTKYGADELDESSFWTFTMSEQKKHVITICGNIIQHPHILEAEIKKSDDYYK